MRKSLLVLLALIVLAGAALFGRSLLDSEDPKPPDVRVDSAGVSTDIDPLPAKGKISVYPAPGVTSAAPRTQISFRGAPADELGKITVTGSRTARTRAS